MRIGVSVATVAALVLVLSFVVAFVLDYGAGSQGKFTIVNKANEPIVQASVVVCGQTMELRNIQPGDVATGSYKVNCEGHFIILVEFASGKKIESYTGYITPGMDFEDEITVAASIEFTNRLTQ